MFSDVFVICGTICFPLVRYSSGAQSNKMVPNFNEQEMHGVQFNGICIDNVLQDCSVAHSVHTKNKKRPAG